MSDLWTPPSLIIPHPSLFTAKELSLFEKEILANPNASEHDASRFFERFPKFLFLGQGKEVRREVVVTSADKSTSFRIDFFRKSYGNAYWDIIELKSPQKSFVIGSSTNHPKLSSDVNAAIGQAQNYRHLIIQDTSVRSKLLEKGILVYCPQILVVVGKNNQEVSPERMQFLYDSVRQGPIEARSYLDLFNFAKEHYEATGVFIFFAQQGSSQPESSADILVLERVEEALRRIVSPRARFPFTGGPIRVEVTRFDPVDGNLNVDIGACRFVEGIQLNGELNRLICDAVPEVKNVSAGFREL